MTPGSIQKITGVDGDDNETSQITGVSRINLEGNSHDPEGNSQITGVSQINLEGNSHDPEGNSHENEGNID